MLKPAADAAQCFGADAEIRSDVAQRHAFYNMRCLLQQVLIAFRSWPELRIYKTLFQPDIITFIRGTHQPLNFVVRRHQPRDVCFADGPQNAAFEQLNIFHGGLLRNKGVKRGDEIGCEGKPVRDFFFIKIIKPAQGAAFEEVQMTAGFTFCYQTFALCQYHFGKAIL